MRPRARAFAFAFAVGTCLLVGCGPAVSTDRVLVPPPSDDAVFDDAPAALPRYHSKRLGLSVPLPDGRSWRIDDHSRPELVATHPTTRSRLAIALFRTEQLVGRQQCEQLARERGFIASMDLRTVEDDVAMTQQTFDTRVWVAVSPGAAPDRPLVGHVMAFGGFLRKCYVFDYSSEVSRGSGESVLSSRLAFARTRILAGLQLDPFADVVREDPKEPRR